ncbi:hypothetical protein V7O66_07790 [Methanolobus sp. ZRKC3]|uniref:hypothetical protein n=1 Tax=Methanolobus sp. ZRKC3 TaxID=3125786 RepID=UPI00324E45C5
MKKKPCFESNKYGRILLVFLVLLVSAIVILPSGCLDTEVNVQEDLGAESQIQDAVSSDNFESTDVDADTGSAVDDTSAELADDVESKEEPVTQKVTSYFTSGRSGSSSSSSSSDATAPTFAGTYPKTASVAATQLNLLTQTNENGNAYFVVLADGAAAPTAAQIKAGTDAADGALAANLKGTVALTADTEASKTITSLTESTAYDIYVVAEDAVPNLMAAGVKVDVTTADATAPTFAGTYPKTASVAATQLNLLTQTNENGNAYFVVLADGAAAPTAAQIKAGTDAADGALAANLKGTVALTADTEASKTITSLTESTAYDIYVVAEDAVPNLMAAGVKVDVTTADATAPTFAGTYPKTASVAATQLNLLTQTNENGNAYFVVLADGAAAPTAAQIKAGTDAADGALAANLKGTVALTADTEASKTITSLTESTAYDIYVVAEDAVPNLMAAGVKVDVTTADATAPTFAGTYPKTASVAATQLNLLTQTNENGNAYFVVLADGAAAPTAAQIKAGTDAADGALAANLKGTVALTADTEASKTITGLTGLTAYDIYVVAEDGVPNLMASGSKVDVTTS